MLHNDKNTPPFPLMQAPVVAQGKAPEDPCCLMCKEEVE
jgi:hypothetical protein